MTARADLLELAQRYFRALEESDRDALEQLLDASVVHEELPNRIQPNGRTADRATMLLAFEAGKSVLRAQRYEIESAIAECNRIALQVRWSGTLERSIGARQPGETIHAHFAVFLETHEGRIVSQRNYDCFEPF
jgi:ketosteroid isomerase-like protein